MVRCRIAISTDGKNGLEDVVSNVFGRAKTFTIVDAEDEKIIGVKVIANSALSYAHGAGPIAIKTLIDDGVNVVIASELGVGASELLWQHGTKYVQAKPGTVVAEVVKGALSTRKRKTSHSS